MRENVERVTIQVRVKLPEAIVRRIDAFAVADRRDRANAVRVLIEAALDSREAVSAVASMRPLPASPSSPSSSSRRRAP